MGEEKRMKLSDFIIASTVWIILITMLVLTVSLFGNMLALVVKYESLTGI